MLIFQMFTSTYKCKYINTYFVLIYKFLIIHHLYNKQNVLTHLVSHKY